MHTMYQHYPDFSFMMTQSRHVDPLSIKPAQTMISFIKKELWRVYLTYHIVKLNIINL